MLRWEGRALVLDVATIFLSRRKGAIYFALSGEAANGHLPPAAPRVKEAVAAVSFQYRNAADLALVQGSAVCRLVAPGDAQEGLRRGAVLVDEYLTLKRAAQLHHVENNQAEAFRLVSGLSARLKLARDPAFDNERTLVRDLHNTLAMLSGNTGEMLAADGKKSSPLAGVWRETKFSAGERTARYAIFWPNGIIELRGWGGSPTRRASITLTAPLPTGRRGSLPVAKDVQTGFDRTRFEISDRDILTLHAAKRDGVDEALTFVRGSHSEVADPKPALTEPVELDELSGLPRRGGTAAAGTDGVILHLFP